MGLECLLRSLERVYKEVWVISDKFKFWCDINNKEKLNKGGQKDDAYKTPILILWGVL